MQVWSSSFIPSGTIHCPGVDVPQPAAVLLIGRRITLSSWKICLLVAMHAELNCAAIRTWVSRTEHGRLAQYGCESCDGAHEEAGLGRDLVQPASLSLHGKKGDHPAVIQPAADQRWTRQQQRQSIRSCCQRTSLATDLHSSSSSLGKDTQSTLP